MNQSPTTQSAVPKSASNTIPIRVHKSTARTIRQLISKVNKWPYGRKVKVDQIISKGISLLSDDHLLEIKESTYSSEDRLEIEHKKFCKKNGAISKEEFLQKILNSAINSMES